MACVATWSFGLQAVSVASECLLRDERSVEVLEKAINGWSNSLRCTVNILSRRMFALIIGLPNL